MAASDPEKTGRKKTTSDWAAKSHPSCLAFMERSSRAKAFGIRLLWVMGNAAKPHAADRQQIKQGWLHPRLLAKNVVASHFTCTLADDPDVTRRVIESVEQFGWQRFLTWGHIFTKLPLKEETSTLIWNLLPIDWDWCGDEAIKAIVRIGTPKDSPVNGTSATMPTGISGPMGGW